MNANQSASKNAKKDFKKSQDSNAKKGNPNPPDSSLSKINLSAFTEKLSNVNVKEKRMKETIYVYPEGKGKDWINSDEGKKWRNKRRSSIRRMTDNILLFAKHNRIEDLQKEIDLFQKDYKTYYRLNDFSIHSISNSQDEGKIGNLSLALDIIKSLIK
jgi:hypothetical protein